MIVHLNGRLVPAAEARVSPFDRGYLFGDGVYEGLRAFAGRIVGLSRHVDRLREGLEESRIAWNADRLVDVCAGLLEANRLADAFIYVQVTRGAPGPGQPVRTRIPAGPMEPAVFAYCTPQAPLSSFDHAEPATVSVRTRPDTRWSRGRLKSISLLGNVLSAIEASEHAAGDAILVRDGLVAEATAANVLLARAGRVVTPSLESVPILAGVTRAILLEACPEIESRAVAEHELAEADEVMIVGTTTMVTSVVTLDGRPVGDGRPGPVARRLLGDLVGAIRRDIGLHESERCTRAAASR
ncbi:MAG: aminotransferase class IV [Phycisphaerae bacterium]|nr:aminotransferase class IV [Phycisphaerae bacterium]